MCNKRAGGDSLLTSLIIEVSSLSGNVWVPDADFVPSDQWELGQDTGCLLGPISSVKGGGLGGEAQLFSDVREI